jgi:heat shock protein HslJ
MKLKSIMSFPILMAIIISISCSSSKVNTGTHQAIDVNSVTLAVPLQDIYWKLISLVGKPIDTSKNLKEMYIVFKTENNRAEGNGGCNTFAGSYQLKGDSSVFLSEIASTKMYCEGIENENAFFMALSRANHFQIHDDTLILSEDRAMKLARFVAVLSRNKVHTADKKA